MVALHCQKLPCPMLDTPTKVDGAALTHTHMRSMSCTHIHMHSVYGVAYNELDGQLGLTGTGAGVGAAAAVGSS